MRYSFSGHESFHCKSLWLKKGYDFLIQNGSFNDSDSVMTLGVGKNMVSSIRFWLKAFGLTENDQLKQIAHYFFSENDNRDLFCEDIATLWLLHFQLVNSKVASIYNLVFIDFQRERKEFDKEQLKIFIKRKCSTSEQKNTYNENTVKKDIAVLLQTYIAPIDLKQIDRFTALLINLNLIREVDSGRYRFNEIDMTSLPLEILFYSLIEIKGDDKLISFDKIQYLSLLFCMPITVMLEGLDILQKKYPKIIAYTDNSGIRNVFFKKDIDSLSVLNFYYNMK